ncbi:MAG: ABC transporter ATP-binding protein [Polyangiaceae bacterium]|nr:ABC transporter ATP-binding protein [Polyangiaceae bacterium]
MNRRLLKRVEVQNLSKIFGATPALRGQNTEFHAGTITILGGANGAGKSTLLSILGHQLKATKGVVRMVTTDGLCLTKQEARSQIGWLSHTTNCYQQLSGRANIEILAKLHGIPAPEIERVTTRLHIGRFAERPISTLSRGQSQRIALARAIVHQPALLLLDEPWTGLDTASAKQLEAIVQEEAERGAIVVIVSHQDGLATKLNANSLLLKNGQLLK